ncbi:MAG: hypothetical protein KC800_01715 [Candidatus Eremiobacteraeota bacterium]|nr:hypothetical protein [Candidatus Eremiobacteraeota bacterium]
MNRFRYGILGLVLFLLAGCHSEKSEVVDFLKELEASNQRLEVVSRDYQEVVSTVSEESLTGKVDKEAAKKKLHQIAVLMGQEIKRVEGLQVPEKAQGLQGAVLDQYRVLVETVESTGPLVDILSRLSEANRLAAEDPGVAAKITQEMKKVEAERAEIARRLDDLMEKGRQDEETARQEQQKLQKEFGIAVKMEKR